MNKFAKGILTIGGIAGAGAICFVTGGLAAPAIGSVIGSTFMGLSGAAATSAGLAALGGGSLAAGGAGNTDLKAKYQDLVKNDKSKQEIIKTLQAEINNLKKERDNLDKDASGYKEKYEDLMEQIAFLEEKMSEE